MINILVLYANEVKRPALVLLSLLIISVGCSSSNRTATGGRPATVDTVKQVSVPIAAEPVATVSIPDTIQPLVELLRSQLQLTGGQLPVISINQADVDAPGVVLLLTRAMLSAPLGQLAKPLEQMNPEAYLVKGNGKNVILIGNSAVAVRHAIYDYLEQLGFRYFQPGEEWQIVPAIKKFFPVYSRITQPAFHTRVLANGHGYLKNDKLAIRFNNWAQANKLGGFFELNIGHTYQVTVANNRKTFLEHPEYFAGNVKKGEIPATPKFNVANKDLVNLVKEDALFRIKESARIGKPLMMVSMEPSDGGGFCTSPDCLKIGNTSDQVFYLANEVARYVQKYYPGMWVGSLAYNEHILPPRMPLEKNVFVMVANGFNRSKFNTYELLQQWGKLVKKTGVYEYLNVYEWDNDLPGKSSASQLAYVRSSIPAFYKNGATAYMAETNVGWISKGLGQYVVAKLLWDPQVNVDSLVNDYYNKCFGGVAPIIRKLYNSWENAPKGILSDNWLADWIDWVMEADRQNKDIAIARRLDHIKLYLHYLALYKKLKSAPSPQLMKEVLIFANRTMELAAFSTVPVMASLPKYSGYPEMSYYANPQQSWRQAVDPVTTREINQLIQQDRKSLIKIEGLRSYSETAKFVNFRPAATSPALRIKNPNATFVGTTRFVLRIDKKSAENVLELTSGLSAKVNPGKPVTVKVFDLALFQKIKAEADVLLQHEQFKMGVKEKFSFASLKPGDYMVEIEDLQRSFNVRFSGQLHFNVVVSPDLILQTSSVTGLNNFIVKVPEGVTQIVINKSKSLKVLSPAGRQIDFADNKTGAYVVEIKKGETGDWLFFYQAGILNIEGIPPYLGIDPNRFLAPENP